jgi:hypothetical protein
VRLTPVPTPSKGLNVVFDTLPGYGVPSMTDVYVVRVLPSKAPPRASISQKLDMGREAIKANAGPPDLNSVLTANEVVDPAGPGSVP